MSRTSNHKSTRIGRNGRWRNGSVRFKNKYLKPLKRTGNADEVGAMERLHGDHIKPFPITVGVVARPRTVTTPRLVYKTGDFYPVHKGSDDLGWGIRPTCRNQRHVLARI